MKQFIHTRLLSYSDYNNIIEIAGDDTKFYGAEDYKDGKYTIYQEARPTALR